MSLVIGHVDPAAGTEGSQGVPRDLALPTERLDQDKIEILRTWGEGLLNDGRAEVGAAGRAILLLIEEIERLNVDLWHAGRLEATEDAPEATSEKPAEEVGSALRRRLGAFRYQTPSPPADER